MNRVVMMGRLTREPEVKYGQNGNAVARYGIAVDKRYKRDGEPDADFFNVVSFWKAAEFVEKYLHKGTKIVLEGELRNNNYTKDTGEKVYNDVIVTSYIEFAESKAVNDQRANNGQQPQYSQPQQYQNKNQNSGQYYQPPMFQQQPQQPQYQQQQFGAAYNEGFRPASQNEIDQFPV